MKASSIRHLESIRGERKGQGAALARAAAITVLLLLVGSPAFAEVPDEMAYSGRLTDASGVALSGPVAVQLRIYDQLEDGGLLYTEDHAGVEPDEDGFFEVPLGGGVVVAGVFEATLFSGIDRYLEVAVDGATLSPRQKMGSVPYAMQAEIAQQSSHADAADDAARLDGSTLPEILALFNPVCTAQYPLAASACPFDPADYAGYGGILKCDDAPIGSICEGDGECGTDTSLNNCGLYDLYYKAY